jgi:hypothetical protein
VWTIFSERYCVALGFCVGCVRSKQGNVVSAAKRIRGALARRVSDPLRPELHDRWLTAKDVDLHGKQLEHKEVLASRNAKGRSITPWPLFPLIHPSAWKGNSPKLVCSILHTPGPTGSENIQ